MSDSTEDSVAHPQALKIVLALGGIFVLVLIGARLAGLAAFLQALSDRVPVLLVEPGILGDCVLALAIMAALPAFLLPRPWQVATWGILFIAAPLAIAISGNRTLRGNSGSAHTPLAHWLQSQGYARCPAEDRLRSGRRGEFVAESWAQPGACVAAPDAPGQAQ